MKRRRRLYESPTKILYEGFESNNFIQFFKDNIYSYRTEKHEIIEGKGALNNRISEYLLLKLGQINVPTHLIRRLNMYEQLIKAVEMIPLTVAVRNVAAGSMAERFGLKEGTNLPQPIIEFYYKKEGLTPPLVSAEHINAFGWAAPQELDDILQYAIRINDFLLGLFAGKAIKLVDFKLEFGRLWDGDMMQLVLAEELSPDTMRLWDETTHKKLNKDLLYEDKNALIAGYVEVANRLGVLNKTTPSFSMKPVLVKS